MEYTSCKVVYHSRRYTKATSLLCVAIDARDERVTVVAILVEVLVEVLVHHLVQQPLGTAAEQP